MSDQTRFMLTENDIPSFGTTSTPTARCRRRRCSSRTKEPVTPDFLSVLFPMELILQEISTERYIEIPEEVREIYKLYRPTPLMRARRLEKALGTPAHIYLQDTKASRRPAATNPTPPSRRPSTTRRPAPRP